MVDGSNIGVSGARVVESPAYEIGTPAGKVSVCDCIVVASLHSGLDVFHTRVVARGMVKAPSGEVTAVDARAKAQSVADRVAAAGAINLGLWAPLPWDEAGTRALWRSLGTPPGVGWR